MGRIGSPQRYPVLFPGTCEYVRLQGKGGIKVADGIKVVNSCL